VSRFLDGAPAELVAELEHRNATIELSWRENDRAFARTTAREGGLFARYSDDLADAPRLEHETKVRSAVGSDGALRTPPVIAQGSGWRIERAIDAAEPWQGPDAVDAAAAAAAEIPALDVPRKPSSEHPRALWFHEVGRIARAVIGPISISDLRSARRELADTDLPTVICHRDFHPKNLLLDETGVWVIDWERVDPGPLGLDLLRLWCSLADPADRERVFEHAVDQVGASRRASLERLRYAVAVAEASGLHLERNPFDRDDATLARLLELIPSLRPER
jgi:phosphotransferase family enzyme